MTSSAFDNASRTVGRFGMLAAGFVPMIQTARISPLPSARNIRTAS